MENTKKDVQNEKIAKKGARIMIAAPQSGSGKTLITCALLQALKEKNYHLESLSADQIILIQCFIRQFLEFPQEISIRFLQKTA